MKKNNCIFTLTVFSLFFHSSIFGQIFLNGSFEITTGNCSYTVINSNFSSMMNNCYAFGSASQIDIMNGTCGYGSAQQGNNFIGIAVDVSNTLTDAFSLKLSTPLIAGNNYVINFYNRKHPDYDVNLLEVGYSVDSLSFGSIINTAALPTTSWGLVSFSFMPTVNCQFITVRTIAGSPIGWNFVDNFTISQTTSLIDTNTEEHAIQVFPNPTNGIINIKLNNTRSEETTVEILNTLGQILLNENHTTTNFNLNISTYSEGIYYLKIAAGTQTQVIKLIKN